MVEPASGHRWFARGAALFAALLLVGGGGALALNAGTANGGAETPEGALSGALTALSAEDLVGAAEFVEPAERDTLVAAGFDMVDEMIRLEVFDESFDLGSVDGFDLEFTDLEISTVEIQPGLAHLFIDRGTVRSAVDGSALPLGALVTDRVGADTLAVTEQTTEQLTPSSSPIVAVQRDGRWYLSLWYTVAEVARLETGAALPNAADRLPEIGAESPEAAVENFVRATERLDLATMIGMLDPEEMSVLYDYGSLFVGDAQAAADELLAAARNEGWSWEVTELEQRAAVDGDLATVVIERLDLVASGPGTSFEISFDGDRVVMSMEAAGVEFDMVAEGDCVTVTVDEGRGPESDQLCADEMFSAMGLGSVTAATSASSGPDAGIIVRRVDGRWYLSPVRTGSTMMLQSVQAFDAEGLAETVDAITDLVRDPFGGTAFFEVDELIDPLDEGELGTDLDSVLPDEFDYPAFTEENIGLLAPGPDFFFTYDLVAGYREDVWRVQFPEVEAREFGAGVVGEAILENGDYAEIGVLQDLVFDSDESLAAWAGGEVVTTVEGFTYVRQLDNWFGELVLARSTDGIAYVSIYAGLSDEAVAVLRNQVQG